MELDAIISQIDGEIGRLQQARSVLSNGIISKASSPKKRGGKRRLTAEGRARIAAAVKARWARQRKEKKLAK